MLSMEDPVSPVIPFSSVTQAERRQDEARTATAAATAGRMAMDPPSERGDCTPRPFYTDGPRGRTPASAAAAASRSPRAASAAAAAAGPAPAARRAGPPPGDARAA